MEEKLLKIYFTSDVHGYFFPTTYVDNETKPMGLFACAAGFEKDEDTLIIDGGDILQGSAFANYCRNGLHSPKVMAEIMNDCGYDFYTLGNHDFNYGQEYQAIYRDTMHARCVCENVTSADGETLYPAVIHTMPNGLRIGIVGIVTDFINVWEKKENLEGICVTDPFAAAQKALANLKGKTDLNICIYHGGLEKDLDTGKSLSDTAENIGCKIAEELDFDLLLTGHQHLSIPGRDWCGTFVVQPPSNAREYVYLEIRVRGGENKVAATPEKTFANERADIRETSHNGSHIVEIRSWQRNPEMLKGYAEDSCGSTQDIGGRKKDYQINVSPSEQGLDSGSNIGEGLCKKYAPTEREVQHWLDQPAGQLSHALLPGDKLEMALHGSEIADFVNRVQLHYSGAQLSVTSLANEVTGFRESVTNRDIISTSPFPNTLITCRITGKQLRAVMERSAEYFDTAPDGTLTVAESFLKPKVEHYNYDYYAGVTYEIHPTNPVGQRIANLMVEGKPVRDDDTFTLAINNYRYSGTGGYEVYRDCPRLSENQTELSELIMDYFREFPYIEV